MRSGAKSPHRGVFPLRNIPAVAPAFICLFSMFIAGGAHAQTATDASDSKRVQVLQVQEVSATNESSVKKSKTAATLAKKKVAQRRTTRQTKQRQTKARTRRFNPRWLWSYRRHPHRTTL